jgi:hypothetical protein
VIKALLAQLLKSATFRLYTAAAPVGRRLGGADNANMPDGYIILDIRFAGQILLLGHFQTG